VLLIPVVLNARALPPLAVLLFPVVLRRRALTPLAVLVPPPVFEERALDPLAVLLFPVVLSARAFTPTPVLFPPEREAEERTVLLTKILFVPKGLTWSTLTSSPWQNVLAEDPKDPAVTTPPAPVIKGKLAVEPMVKFDNSI
jgi:hypothetical protein